jgi:hypothetical protein
VCLVFSTIGYKIKQEGLNMKHFKQIEQRNPIFGKAYHTKLMIGLASIFWMMGLLLAGSDSPFMPWVNGLGLLVFLLASIFLGKLLNKDKSASTLIIYPKFSRKPINHSMTQVTKHQNRRVNTRYAMEA